MNEVIENLLPKGFENLTNLQKEAFFNSMSDEKIHISGMDIEIKRSNAQAIYKEIFKSEKKKYNQSLVQSFNPVESINNYFNPNDAKIFIDVLKKQKDNITKLVKEANKDLTLYHCSSTSPDELSGKKLKCLPNWDTYFEQKNDLVFSSATISSLYPFLPPKINGMSSALYRSYNLAVISKKDEFIKAKREKSSFYVFDLGQLKNSTFEPNVSLSGDFSGEYISKKDVPILKYEQKDIRDLLKSEVMVVFPTNENDCHNLMRDIDLIINKKQDPKPFLEDAIKQGRITKMTTEDLNNNENSFAKLYDEIEKRNASYRGDEPKFFIHGSDRDFKGAIPAFSKETQNEIDMFNAVNKKRMDQGLKPYTIDELPKEKRVFATPAIDDKGNPAQMNYAYAIKKTAHAIGKFDESPVIFASQDRYDDFVKSNKPGHIYILEKGEFKPEVTPQGEVFEWTSKKDAQIAKDEKGNDRIIDVDPTLAMQKGVQVLIMKDDKVLDDLRSAATTDSWYYKLSEDKSISDLLDEMIKEGRIEHKNQTDNNNPISFNKSRFSGLANTVSDNNKTISGEDKMKIIKASSSINK